MLFDISVHIANEMSALFSSKNKRNIISLSTAEFARKGLKVKKKQQQKNITNNKKQQQ